MSTFVSMGQSCARDVSVAGRGEWRLMFAVFDASSEPGIPGVNGDANRCRGVEENEFRFLVGDHKGIRPRWSGEWWLNWRIH